MTAEECGEGVRPPTAPERPRKLPGSIAVVSGDGTPAGEFGPCVLGGHIGGSPSAGDLHGGNGSAGGD